MEAHEGDLLISIVDKCEYCKWCWNCDIQNKLLKTIVDCGEKIAFTLKICDDFIKEDENHGRY